MIKFIININEQDKRLDNLLAKKFNIPKTLVFKLNRTKKIKVNQRYVENNYKCTLNDEVLINFDLQPKNKVQDKLSFHFKQTIKILYEDENIVLIDKPIGILSQPDEKNCLCIQNLFLQYLHDNKKWDPKDSFVPSICNRLDFNTSGIIIAAKNAVSLNEMNSLIKDHQINKYYKVMVFGKPPKREDLLTAYHFKNKETNIVHISDKFKQGYKEIQTKYRLLKTNNKWSILEIELITGKTHQIRAHLNHIGLNVVGEQKYKNQANNIDNRFKTQALVSYKIKFNVPNSYHLAYLNKKIFQIDHIWFEKYFD